MIRAVFSWVRWSAPQISPDALPHYVETVEKEGVGAIVRQCVPVGKEMLAAATAGVIGGAILGSYSDVASNHDVAKFCGILGVCTQGRLGSQESEPTSCRRISRFRVAPIGSVRQATMRRQARRQSTPHAFLRQHRYSRLPLRRKSSQRLRAHWSRSPRDRRTVTTV
jgi:hypothetical protein